MEWISLFGKESVGNTGDAKYHLSKVPNGGSQTECLGMIALQHAAKFLLTNHVSFVVKFLGIKSRRSAGIYTKTPSSVFRRHAEEKS